MGSRETHKNYFQHSEQRYGSHHRIGGCSLWHGTVIECERGVRKWEINLTQYYKVVWYICIESIYIDYLCKFNYYYLVQINSHRILQSKFINLLPIISQKSIGSCCYCYFIYQLILLLILINTTYFKPLRVKNCNIF